MKKVFYLGRNITNYEMVVIEEPYRRINNLKEVEDFIKALQIKAGYNGYDIDCCYVDFKDYKEVPLEKAKEKSKKESFEQIIIKGNRGLEILLRSGNPKPSEGIFTKFGGSFSIGIFGYIKLDTIKEESYDKIEELIDKNWPEKKYRN